MSDLTDLLREAATTIERLNKEVSILIAECQELHDRCVNGTAAIRSHEPCKATICSDRWIATAAKQCEKNAKTKANRKSGGK